MQSITTEYTDGQTIYVNAAKYRQGNSQSDFLLVAAKERKNGKLAKVIDLLLVPKTYIRCETLASEALARRPLRRQPHRCRNAATAVMKHSQSDPAGLRAFPNILSAAACN